MNLIVSIGIWTHDSKVYSLCYQIKFFIIQVIGRRFLVEVVILTLNLFCIKLSMAPNLDFCLI